MSGTKTKRAPAWGQWALPRLVGIADTLEECLGGNAATCHGQARHSSLPPHRAVLKRKKATAAGVPRAGDGTCPAFGTPCRRLKNTLAATPPILLCKNGVLPCGDIAQLKLCRYCTPQKFKDQTAVTRQKKSPPIGGLFFYVGAGDGT